MAPRDQLGSGRFLWYLWQESMPTISKDAVLHTKRALLWLDCHLT